MINQKIFQDIKLESNSNHLKDEILKELNSATLDKSALKFLGTLIKKIKPNFIFEFGSGLSTWFLSDNLRKNKSAQIFSVDHSPFYIHKTQKMCVDSQNLTFFLCSINFYTFRFKGFATYNSSYLKKLPSTIKFDLILIDGPSGRRFGREAPLYQIAPYMTSETLIFFHDTNRISEQKALSNWRRVWPQSVEILFTSIEENGFVICRLINPSQIRSFPFTFNDVILSWPKACKRLINDYLRMR